MRPSRFHLTVTCILYKEYVMNRLSQTASLDAAFLALSDPTRRAILARLTKGEATVMQLAQPFAMTQPAISRHLKVLEGAGLITRRAEGTTRPCRLSQTGLDTVDQWLALLRDGLSRNYDRLDQLLATMKSEE